MERRDLMAFSSLGYSLPDLTINGISAGPRAAWGGTVGVNAFIDNIGASTLPNPIAQAPGDVTTADASPSTVAVLITPRPFSLKGAVEIGTIAAPEVPQNSIVPISGTFNLPSRPAGFGAHGKFYIRLVANTTGSVVEANPGNNISEAVPVKLVSSALPELRTVAFEVPSSLSPGDTISPTISIANFGTAPTPPGLEVALVASTTPSFTVGSSIVALYQLAVSIPPESSGPGYVYTFTAPAVTLPTSPSTYYLGIVIDPYGKVNQSGLPKNVLEDITVVGPSGSGLPSAGVLSSPNNNPFPESPSGTPIGISS